MSSSVASSSIARVPITYTTTVSGTPSAVETSVQSGHVPGLDADPRCWGPAMYPTDTWTYGAGWNETLQAGEFACNGNNNNVTAHCCAQYQGQLAKNVSCGVDSCKISEEKQGLVMRCIGDNKAGGACTGKPKSSTSSAARHGVGLALVVVGAALALSV